MKEKISNIYITFCIYAFIGWLYEVTWMWFVVPPKHFINRGVLLGPFLPIYGFGMLILLFILKRFYRKKHSITNPKYLSIYVITIITFIYTTIIEYSTTPKILNVLDYLKDYGLILVIINILGVLIVSYLVRKKIIKELDTTIVLTFLIIWIITTLIEYISHYAIDKMTGKLLWDYTKDFLNINKRVNWDASRNFAIGGTFLLYVVQPKINILLKKIKTEKKYIISLIIGIPMLLDYLLHVVLKII